MPPDHSGRGLVGPGRGHDRHTAAQSRDLPCNVVRPDADMPGTVIALGLCTEGGAVTVALVSEYITVAIPPVSRVRNRRIGGAEPGTFLLGEFCRPVVTSPRPPEIIADVILQILRVIVADTREIIPVISGIDEKSVADLFDVGGAGCLPLCSKREAACRQGLQ